MNMATKEELQAIPATLLAVRCRKIGDDASLDPATREKAHNLVIEWTRLQRSPDPNLAEQRKIEAEQAAQKSRMVDFLIMF